jgi:hypothetical protein
VVYQYKDYIDKNLIEVHLNTDENLRYLIKVPLINNGNKTVLVIMKNPSKADNIQSDMTINNVLNFASMYNYRVVYIMNLYSYYSTDPDMIGNLVRNNKEHFAIGEKNDEILKNVVNKVDEVIVGWGSDSFGCTKKYKDRIRTVTEIIRNKELFYVQSIGGRNWYPRHPQVWHMKSNLELFSWIPPF